MDHTIRAARAASRIHSTFVSTESREIAQQALRTRARVIRRPQSLSLDSVSMDPVLLHAAEELLASGGGEGREAGEDLWVVLLQPTSPLRNASDIDGAITHLEEVGAQGLVSVVEVDREVYKYMTVGDDGFLKGMVSPRAPFMRRQDCPTVVRPNGAIYVYRVSTLLQRGGFYFQGVAPYLMPQERSLDIDVPADLLRAEELMTA